MPKGKRGIKPAKYHAEEYRGINIAWTESSGNWVPYINRKLIPNVAFATAENARAWCRSRIDKELADRPK